MAFYTWLFETVEGIKKQLFEEKRKKRLQKMTYQSEEHKRSLLRKKKNEKIYKLLHRRAGEEGI